MIDRVTNACNQVSKKLHVLASFSQFMGIHKRKMTTKAFVTFVFGYFLLVWMFHNRKLNSRKNKIHERE